MKDDVTGLASELQVRLITKSGSRKYEEGTNTLSISWLDGTD